MITKESFNKLMVSNTERREVEVARNLMQAKGALMDSIKMKKWAMSKLNAPKYDKWADMEIISGKVYDKLEDEDFRYQANMDG
jgi:hypothetical protein